MLAGLGGFAWVIVMWLSRALHGLDGTVGGLSMLFGGWRSPSWPTGVQEDDPEVAWAVHHRSAEPPPGADPRAGADDDDPPFASWIELID